jgi:type VI secretion system secreted protein VgrG
VTISGMPVLINSGGAAGAGSGASPEAPQSPKEAVIAKPGEQSEPPPPPEPPSAAAVEQAEAQRETLIEAAKSGVPFCEKCEAARRTAAGG